MEKWEVIIFGIVLDMPIFIENILQAGLIPVAMIWHFTIYIYLYLYIYMCVCVCVECITIRLHIDWTIKELVFDS
jgi:hypothetical protein